MGFLLTRGHPPEVMPDTLRQRARLGRWSFAVERDADVEERPLATGRAFVFGRPWARETEAPPRWERAAAHRGRVPLDRVDGSFAVVFHEAATGHMWLATDRHGSQPVYVASTPEGGAVAAGSSAREVARARRPDPPPDPIGILQWLHCGYIPTARTVFEDVRRAPYGTWTCLDTGEVARYWRFDGTAPPGERPESAWLDGLLAHQDRAVARALSVAPRATTLLLSGGWDSRAMLARLAGLAARGGLTTATFGAEGGDDVRAARALAARVGAPHVLRPNGFEAVDQGVRAWARATGDLADNVFATLPLGPGQLEGIPGEALWVGTDSFSTVLPPARPERAALAESFGDLPPAALDALAWLSGAVSSRSLLPPEVDALGLLRPCAEAACEAAFDEILERLEPSPGEAWDATFDRLSHETRFRVWNVNRALFERARPVLTPWHDVDLVEYYAGMPQALRGLRLAHRRANERASDLFHDPPMHSQGMGRDALDVLRHDPRLRALVRERVAATRWVGGAVDEVGLGAILDDGEASPQGLWGSLRLYLACTTYLAALS